MSIWCCRIPNFLVRLEYRHAPEISGKPLGLLDPDEHLLDVSPEALSTGVYAGMTTREALTRCPELILRDVDMGACQVEQDALMSRIAECGLPTEQYGWGEAYLDLHTVATTADSVRPLLFDMGRQVRQVLGDSLPATGGWDTGKFTARVAAKFARPNSMHLVDRTEEEQFLRPKSITLLPLPVKDLEQLYRFGICTLGDFARLPPIEVWQRFGKAGKIAQQWARGKDDRPVAANVIIMPQPVEFEFDPPTSSHTRVLEETLNTLRPRLIQLEHELIGCRRLRVDLKYDNGENRVIDCVFVEPVSDGRRLRATLSYKLQTLNWPAALSSLKLTLLETSELVARQLTLFDLDDDQSPIHELSERLSRRHGTSFFLASVVDEQHPIAERRVDLNDLGGADAE